MPTQVVFNLYPFGELLHLPSAFLVQTGPQGELTYVLQRAMPATLHSQDIELTPVLTRLFELTDQLTPKNLEARFKPPKAKTPSPLAQLLTDPATKPSVEKFIFEKLDALLGDLVQHKLPLTLDIEKKTLAKNVQVVFAADELVPHISFAKTPAGVEYRFQLGTEDEKWPIRSREVLPLTNTDPAWLLVDYALFRVPGINGNMVKPFRNKDVVQIPPDKARVYFRQFVAKNAGRTRIEAEGFGMTTTNDLLKTRLVPTENVLEKAWYLKVVFVYPGAEFAHGERRDRVTAVDFASDGSEEVVVRQVQRDADLEIAKLDFLEKNGLEADGKLFRVGGFSQGASSLQIPPPEQAPFPGPPPRQTPPPTPPPKGRGVSPAEGMLPSPSGEGLGVGSVLGEGLTLGHPPQQDHPSPSLESLITWLSTQRATLEAAGFVLELPQVEGRPVALLSGSLELTANIAGDWFDVLGQVRAGDFTFPFKLLWSNLRRRDRLFRLPDDTYFLIPEEWFARYAELAEAAQDGAGETLRLPKALFTILQSAGLEESGEGATLPEIDLEKIDYRPSADLKADLRPYQLQGVKWLIGHYRAGFGACLADDMGLGKTLQTIAVLLYAKEKKGDASLFAGQAPSPLPRQASTPPPRQAPPPTPPPKGRGVPPAESMLPSLLGEGLGVGPASGEGSESALDEGLQPVSGKETVPSSLTQLDLFQSYRAELRPLNALVILPASLVFNWQNELARFAPTLFVCAHTGPKRLSDARALAGHDVVLTTYHTARQDLNLLGKIAWHIIVLDESQQIKNRASEVSKVVLSLRADSKISLSGTPIENSLSDLWTQMEFINPATLGSFREFREQFILPIEKRDDASAKQRLFSRVRPFFLRRTKEEVAPELPALTEQLFFSEMTAAQEKLYQRTKSAVRNEILALFDDPKTRVLALQALTRLRQLANDPRLVETDYTGGAGKFDDVLAQWDTVRRAGHKVLFFSSFERHLRLFRGELEAAGQAFAWLTGDTPTAERAREVERFQTDPSVQAFFMTVKAGGVGLNLTAADYVFLLDPWWNPAAEDQAIARAHRIGQLRPVTAVRFLARDTIEEKIRQLQEQKKKLGQALFADSDETLGITREDLEGLLG